MKKLLLFVALIAATTVSAQFYVSGSVGYAFASGSKELSDAGDAFKIKNLKGSYGEGVNTQLRFGYFFNEKWGAELGVGYLHGADQQVTKSPLPNVKARGRAFGASLAAVYNITDNFYARAGFLTKLGGKTEALGEVKTNLEGKPVPNAPAGTNFPKGTYTQTKFVQDNKGKFPLGFIAALGYKHPLAENWSIFGEVDYMGINVDANKAIIREYKTDLHTPDGKVTTIQTIKDLKVKEFNYVDNPTKPNELKSRVAPYSSFGINFGVIYSFGK